jgi:hypothetical protein
MRSDEFKKFLIIAIYILTGVILLIEYNDLLVFDTIRLCSSYLFFISLICKYIK